MVQVAQEPSIENNIYFTLGEIKSSVTGLNEFMKDKFKTLEDKIDVSHKNHEVLEERIVEESRRITELENKIKVFTVNVSIFGAVVLAVWAVFGPIIQRMLGVIN